MEGWGHVVPPNPTLTITIFLTLAEIYKLENREQEV
jgi:hypothetical protein